MKVFKIRNEHFINVNEITEFNTNGARLFITTKDNSYSISRNGKTLLAQIKENTFNI